MALIYQAWKYGYSYNGPTKSIILENIFREQTKQGFGKLKKKSFTLGSEIKSNFKATGNSALWISK